LRYQGICHRKIGVLIIFVIIIIGSLVTPPYLSAMQLKAEYRSSIRFTEAYGHIQKVNVSFRILNGSPLDLVLRDLKAEYTVENSSYTSSLNLPSNMTGQEGFILSMLSFEDLTVVFIISSSDWYGIPNAAFLKFSLSGQVSCRWYARRFTIDIILENTI
jgi:hypothetical protein